MTTTMVATVRNIRRILNDNPIRVALAAAITDTTTATFTVAAADIGKFSIGQIWEHDDGSGNSAELRYTTAVDSSTNTVTADRGFNASTAATHGSGAYILLSPRFVYDKVAQAVNTTLDHDLYHDGIYEIVEHQVTSSATNDDYNAPSTSCERFLDVYQRVNASDAPTRRGLTWSQRLFNVDSTIHANGRYAIIRGNVGTPGSAIYYVSCAHKLGITTISASQERIVHMLGCAYLLEWEEPRRAAGPTNQGDRTVRVGDQARLAAYYRDQYRRMVRQEASYLQAQFPNKRVWTSTGF